jgi:tetratricopeptide (TPR) repeat protein
VINTPLLQQEDIERAIADQSEVIRREPTAAAYHSRGQLFYHASEPEDALADFTMALQMEPGQANILLWRAAALLGLNDSTAALADINRALQLDPHLADAYYWRGRAHWTDDDLDSALADFTQAIELEAGGGAYEYRGKLWWEMDQPEKAVADFSAAIRLDPTSWSAHWGRARALDWLGDSAAADADFDRAEELRSETNMAARREQVFTLLQDHFAPASLDDLVIMERRFPLRVRADLLRAVEDFLGKQVVRHFSAIRKHHAYEGISFSDLVVRERDYPAVCVPPQYDEVDIGEQEPLRCLKSGFWLLEDDGRRFAVLMVPAVRYEDVQGVRIQVATTGNGIGPDLSQKLFKHLEEAIREARSYRGKVLSLEEGSSYSGAAPDIRVHRLHRVERGQVILPRKTLALLERNVLQFVRYRPQLAESGLATKKGLLFYGPPGTGKTHTIHYLAGALPGMTTLLISAEQVGLLGEYMILARLLQPTLVVIEDADLIARERSEMGSVCEEVLLNKLLNEMDGLKEEADILFVLTTNRPESLEAALASRPGRIDQAIEFPFPDEEGREKLVRLYARGVPLSAGLVQTTVKKTKGVSAAFIKELMRRAAQFRLERDGTGELLLEDIDNALEELLCSGGSLNRKLLGGQVEEMDAAET